MVEGKGFSKEVLLMPVVGVVSFFVLLFVFGTFGPGIPFSVSSVQTNKTDLFTVSGNGKASAAPDMAIVNLGIQTKQPTVAAAQTQANQVIRKITDDMMGLGVAAADVSTTNYSIYPDYNYQVGSGTITGYNVSVTSEVKVRDLTRINDVIDRATADGANSIGGLQFTFDDTLMAKLEDQARREAVRAAKAKADSLASAAGITLGRIVNIQENNPNPSPRPLEMMAPSGAAGLGGGTNVQPGTAEVSLTVSLSYQLR